MVQGGTSEGVFQDGVQILQADASPAHAQLAQLVAGSFALLCDVKEAGGDAYYRLSDDKVPSSQSACSCLLAGTYGHC